jgi:hypothetical protein
MWVSQTSCTSNDPSDTRAGKWRAAHVQRQSAMKQPLPRFETTEGELPLRPSYGLKTRLSGTAEASLFTQLSPPRQALIRLCQTINFGSIENLEVRDSEPVFDPPPVVLRDMKLDSDEGPRPELALSDFILSNEILRLMSHLTEMRCGIIRGIEVRGGLPRRILLEQVLQPAAGSADFAGGRKCSGRIPLKQDALGFAKHQRPMNDTGTVMKKENRK